MNIKNKNIIRCFILDKLKEITIFDVHELAAKHDLSSFHAAEQFCIDMERIEKLFNYPSYNENADE